MKGRHGNEHDQISLIGSQASVDRQGKLVMRLLDLRWDSWVEARLEARLEARSQLDCNTHELCQMPDNY
jgi:hypothetical protein